MSDRGRLLALYDAAALGDCTVAVWEHRRPGAADALRLWAGARNMPVYGSASEHHASLYVEMYSGSPAITVYLPLQQT